MRVTSLFWLHFPKCGSTLGTYLTLLFCPTAVNFLGYPSPNQAYDPVPFHSNYNLSKQWLSECQLKFHGDPAVSKRVRPHKNGTLRVQYQTGFGNHYPYKGPYKNTAVVALFRNPIDRLLSHFYHILNPTYLGPDPTEAMSAGFAWYMNPQDTIDRMQALRGLVNRLLVRGDMMEELAYMFAFMGTNAKGMQTKMLLGLGEYEPFSRIPSTWKDDILKIFSSGEVSVVGLLEEFDASVQLMFTQFGVKLSETLSHPVAKAWADLRVNPTTASVEEINKLKQMLLKNGFHDEYDQYTYNLAKYYFYKRCEIHNISTKYSAPA